MCSDCSLGALEGSCKGQSDELDRESAGEKNDGSIFTITWSSLVHRGKCFLFALLWYRCVQVKSISSLCHHDPVCIDCSPLTKTLSTIKFDSHTHPARGPSWHLRFSEELAEALRGQAVFQVEGLVDCRARTPTQGIRLHSLLLPRVKILLFIT